MAQACEIFGKAAKALGIPVLTPEYEIVLALLDFPDLTADQLFERSSLSRAGFFNTIERLKIWGIVISNSGITDRRRRIYRLSGNLRQLIFYRFRKYRVDYIDHERGVKPVLDFMSKDLTARRDRGVDFFSCEYKILFYLYLNPNMPNFALRALIDASETKFHCSLKSLLENGLVTAAEGMGDRRLKIYTISCLARLAILKLHLDIFDWLESCEPAFHGPTLTYASEALATAKSTSDPAPRE